MARHALYERIIYLVSEAFSKATRDIARYIKISALLLGIDFQTTPDFKSVPVRFFLDLFWRKTFCAKI
jgi:hypothetical protein